KQVAAFATCFATMLLPFSISLNNHLPAATATAVVMWIYLYACERLDSSVDDNATPVGGWVWVIAGLAAGFAAANELPALSMTACWFLLCAVLDRSSILPFLGGVAIVAVGFFGTNWLAHQSLRPPYAHRGNGPLISHLETSEQNLTPELGALIRKDLVAKSLVSAETKLAAFESQDANRWSIRVGEQRFALCKVGSKWELREWDDWYDYPGSYWQDGSRVGVDKGEPSRLTYLFQMTVGHYGIFSITPFWLLVPLALINGLSFGPNDFRRLAVAVLLATGVCLLFYVARPMIDRNYGGISVCFRWMLWFAPLWLLMIGPLLEIFGKKRARRNAVKVMLAFSVFSVSTALSGPWQSPWIYQFWSFLGWIET
ncbi:MAG: hypothetical protein AB8B91_12985, partial [Rubripirellula sp.]